MPTTATRQHTAMMRTDPAVLDRAKLAARMMKMSLANYVTEVLEKASDRDIAREARKLTGDNQ